MFGQRTLELNTSVSKVRTCLEGQLSKRRPTGWLRAEKFSLYKCLGSKDQGGFFYFQITGEVAQSGDGTRVTYRVLPDLATCLILLCISVAMITVLAGLLSGKVSGDLVLTVLAVNVIMWGYSLWGVKDLGARFESHLQETEQRIHTTKE